MGSRTSAISVRSGQSEPAEYKLSGKLYLSVRPLRNADPDSAENQQVYKWREGVLMRGNISGE